jgi:hypothetical protein
LHGFAVYRHGAVSGLVGATALAAWFLYLDIANRGRALYTPTLLGTLLFANDTAPATLEALAPSVPMTVAFSVVHGLVFMAMGVAAAYLLTLAQQRPRLPLAILLLFVVLQLGFVAFAMTFAAGALEVLGWAEIILGNVLAATAMITYLWRRWPRGAGATAA